MDSFSKAEIDKHFGKILKAYRKKAKITQEELAEKLGISLKYISRIENGNNGVKTQNLIQYMNILGVPPDTLFGIFMTHPNIKKDMDFYQKITSLSEEQKEFVSSIIDLLKNFK